MRRPRIGTAPSAMTHEETSAAEGEAHPKAPGGDCMEYVVAFQTAMMATTAIVTLTFFLLDLI